VGVSAYYCKEWTKLFAIAKNIDIFCATLVRERDSYNVDEIDPDKLVDHWIQCKCWKSWIPNRILFPEKRIQMILGCFTTGEIGWIGALIGNEERGIDYYALYRFPRSKCWVRIARCISSQGNNQNVTGTGDSMYLLC